MYLLRKCAYRTFNISLESTQNKQQHGTKIACRGKKDVMVMRNTIQFLGVFRGFTFSLPPPPPPKLFFSFLVSSCFFPICLLVLLFLYIIVEAVGDYFKS